MSGKNSVATRKRSQNNSSPAMQKTPEKSLDQHQQQTSHQTQAPPTTATLRSQSPKVEQLLNEIKELKATVSKTMKVDYHHQSKKSIHSVERY